MCQPNGRGTLTLQTDGRTDKLRWQYRALRHVHARQRRETNWAMTVPEIAQHSVVSPGNDELFDGLFLLRVPSLEVGDVAADARVIRVQRQRAGQRLQVDVVASCDVTELLRRQIDHSAASTYDHVPAARWR